MIGGFIINLVTVFILILAMMLWITPFYNLDEFPEVFTVAKNLTLSAVNGTGSMDINPPYNVTVSAWHYTWYIYHVTKIAWCFVTDFYFETYIYFYMLIGDLHTSIIMVVIEIMMFLL